MRIGELARIAGVSTSRIRFYESSRLLPAASRAQNGYRTYGPRDLKIIAFIERAQRLGFKLNEIGTFLSSPPGDRSAQTVLPRLEAKLVEIDAHIRHARERRRDVVALIRELSGPASA